MRLWGLRDDQSEESSDVHAKAWKGQERERGGCKRTVTHSTDLHCTEVKSCGTTPQNEHGRTRRIARRTSELQSQGA